MPKLTRAEISRFAALLKAPAPPDEFATVVDELRDKLGFWALVQDSPFRDAYVAATFARLRKAETVCLGSDPPDVVISGTGGCEHFEIVETYPEGRRRSDEYRALALADDKRQQFGEDALSESERALLAPVLDPEEDWEPRSRTAPTLLRGAAEGKAARGYPHDWGLIIKLDLGGFVHSDKAVISEMVESTAAAGTVFQEVWVLWGDRTWLTWKSAKPHTI